MTLILWLFLQEIFNQADKENEQLKYSQSDEAPLILSDKLRFEVFKYFYATQYQFDIFKKADSSEFLAQILNLCHRCLSTQMQKKNDQGCQCHLHQKVVIREFIMKSCACDPSKVYKDVFDKNNFVHLVCAQDIINDS